MNSIRLTFEQPWLLLLAIPALAIILLPFLRLPKNRRKTMKKVIPVVLHSMLVAILVLILSGFSIVRNSGTQAVMLLLDFSDSTATVRESMTAYAREITDVLKEEAPLGIVAFAEDHVYTVDFNSKDKEITIAEVSADATDIAGALEYAVHLMPSDKYKRIILLSDGKETDGDAIRTAQFLATQDVRIDSVYFDTTTLTTPETQINSITLQENAYTGDTVTLSIELKSNIANSGTLRLYDNDELIEEQEIAVMPGLFMTELSVIAETSGAHTYHLVLDTSQDTIPENNQGYAYLNVAGEPAVLLIADTLKNAAFISNMLSEENAVTTTTVHNAPDSIIELCNYDEIILVNANYNDLPAEYDKLLNTYVSVYGRTLLTVGGANTYMFGNMKGTAFEEMLPVSLTLTQEETETSVALMLVLDCSSSMSRNATYLSVAKQGAIKCVEAMTTNDFVGVISFSSTAKLQSQIIQATDENKDILSRTISGLTTSRGTYYVEALELAHEELLKSTADKKHVIFLSDGNPSDRGYSEAVQSMADDGITVSTIGLGYSSNALSGMAETGSGRYYYVRTASDLPDIMLTETEQITVSSYITGEFVPVIAKESDLTANVGAESLPMLTGYLGTTLKEDATAYLATEEGHPIFASWQYGAGTVAFFASDLYGNWSAEWVNSTLGQSLTKAFVSTTVDEFHDDSSLTLDIALRGKTADITVESFETEDDHTFTVAVTAGDDSNTYTLVQTGSNIYEGSIKVADSGIYELMVMETDASGNIVDYAQSALAVSYSGEYDAFAAGGESLLAGLCSTTGGILTTDVQKIVNSEIDTINLLYNPLIPLGIIVAILLLADIAVRKIRWKDIQNYFYKFQNKP